MHPGYLRWWRARQAHAEAGCGARSSRWGGDFASAAGFGGAGSGSFNVRRPLRFLARRLDLDEKQVAAIAKIVADLKTERAQADVDDRRVIAAFADAVAGATFDAGKAGAAAETRVKSAERLRDAVLAALEAIHAVLDDEQRQELSYLIRTGTLSL